MRNVGWAEERESKTYATRNKKRNILRRKKEAKVGGMSITCGRRRRGKALQKTRMFRRD